MDRATRDKFASGTQSILTTGNACWETPPDVYHKLQHDFGPFDLDLTGDASRHLTPTWLGPDSPIHQFDALNCNWFAFGRSGYSNPPYGPFVAALLRHARLMMHTGFESTLLLPMRATKAFHQYVLDGASELWFCDKRLTFFEGGLPRLNETEWKKGEIRADAALFDSIIVRYVPGVRLLHVGSWQVPPHVSTQHLLDASIRRASLEALDVERERVISVEDPK